MAVIRSPDSNTAKRVAVLTMDASKGDASEGDADSRYAQIDRELSAYGAGLDERPQAVVLNKLDLLPEPPVFEVADPRIVRVFRLSCATGAGVEEFRRALFELCAPAARDDLREPASELADFLVYRPRPRRRSFRILRTEGGFRVVGTPPGEEELAAALRAAGARTGDEVAIGDEELELA